MVEMMMMMMIDSILKKASVAHHLLIDFLSFTFQIQEPH